MQCILYLFLVISVGIAQDIADQPPEDTTCRIVPRLGYPLGTTITVSGVVVEGPSKGYESGAHLRIQRVQGRVSQEDRQIRLSTFLPNEDVDKLIKGRTYILDGYESGGFVGIPADSYRRSGVMMFHGGFGFSHRFVYFSVAPVAPIPWKPADLLGQRAILAGVAAQTPEGPVLRHLDGDVLVTGVHDWESWQIGKEAEALGLVQRHPDGQRFVVQAEHARLVRLADGLGHPVSLRGIACSMNGMWWFSYRGQSLHVEGMEQLPGWSRQLHYTSVEISGMLAEADLPDISQFTIKTKPDLKRAYVVRAPSWKSVDRLLQPERTDDTWQPRP